MARPIRSVEEFYAHALAIEREAADRYAEFFTWFDERGEDALAGLCRSLARIEGEHYQELLESCSNLKLPAIDAADYCWLDGGSPEAPAREVVYRVAKPQHLLEVALKAECRARDYFISIVRTSPARPVRELAAVMAAEERQHVQWVREALEYYGATNIDWEAVIGEGAGPGALLG